MTPPIPAPLPLIIYLSLIIAGVGFVCYGALNARRQHKNTHISHPLNAMDTVAILLSPVWIILIAYILVGLTRMAIAFDPAHQNAELRWHILGFLGLVTALGALISAPLALIRVYTTERQTRTAEQGHMTDRISKAVEQLGAEKTVKISGKDKDGNDKTIEETKPNIEVRIGGLLSLERISQDSVKYDKGRDHVRVMEIICAYVRENAKASDAVAVSVQKGFYVPLDVMASVQDPNAKNAISKYCNGHLKFEPLAKEVENIKAPRMDVRVALEILGLRSEEQIKIEAASTRGAKKERYRLDLRSTNLQRAKLIGHDFSFAQFDDAVMTGAVFGESDLSSASFAWADCTSVVFRAVNLSKTRLIATKFCAAHFVDLKVEERTSAVNAEFAGATFRTSDLSQLFVIEKQLENTHGDASVKLPAHCNRPLGWSAEEHDHLDYFGIAQKWKEDPLSSLLAHTKPETLA